MILRYEYRGYTFADETTVMDDGCYFARVVVMTLGGGRVRSQRFIDLETYDKEADARQRAVSAARAWIDSELDQGREQLALPTNFSALSR